MLAFLQILGLSPPLSRYQPHTFAYSYYDLLLHLPNPLTPQTKSRPSIRFPRMLNRQLMMANPGEETHWSKAFPNSKQVLAISHVNSHLAPEQLLTHPL